MNITRQRFLAETKGKIKTKRELKESFEEDINLTHVHVNNSGKPSHDRLEFEVQGAEVFYVVKGDVDRAIEFRSPYGEGISNEKTPPGVDLLVQGKVSEVEKAIRKIENRLPISFSDTIKMYHAELEEKIDTPSLNNKTGVSIKMIHNEMNFKCKIDDSWSFEVNLNRPKNIRLRTKHKGASVLLAKEKMKEILINLEEDNSFPPKVSKYEVKISSEKSKLEQIPDKIACLQETHSRRVYSLPDGGKIVVRIGFQKDCVISGVSDSSFQEAENNIDKFIQIMENFSSPEDYIKNAEYKMGNYIY